MDLEHLAALRAHELNAALGLLRRHGASHSRLLEIGAGTGQQAKTLAAAGYEVTAIDLPGSRYASARVWPVIEYDGTTLPFADNSFDIVFSSNVLEHIADTDGMQREIARVLTPGGIAVHVLPSPTWRVVTMLAHYPWLVVAAGAALKRRVAQSSAPTPADCNAARVRPSWRRIAYAHRHGEHGNALSEAFHFRRHRWLQVFQRNGFHVTETAASGLLYSGYAVLGQHLSLPVRSRIARWIGSACHLFVMRRPDEHSGQ